MRRGCACSHACEVGSTTLRTPRARRRQIPRRSGPRFGVTCSSWRPRERETTPCAIVGFKAATFTNRLIFHRPHPHLHPRYYTTHPLDIHPPPLLARNQRIALDIANTKITRQAQSWPNACSKVAAPAALGSRSSSSYCWVSGNSAAIRCGIPY